MESAAQEPMCYMLDTNCFDRILDGKLAFRTPPGTTLMCTGVQRDELSRCTPPSRREALLEVFHTLNLNVELASSFCFDIEGAGWGQAHWNDGTGRFDQMLDRLKELDRRDKKKPKDPRNQIRDIVNAETALKTGLILVTTDKNLEKVLIEFGGRAVKFEGFIAQMSNR